jgi:putative flippase GtrA
MQDESLAAAAPPRLRDRRPAAALARSSTRPRGQRAHRRVRRGLRHPHNWLQLVKFCLVGGTGYVVNLTVFALAAGVLDVHHLAAAGLAYLVAVTNNFLLNRHWTFGAGDGHAGFQAARFFTVSTSAALVAAGVLELLVSVAGMAAVPAQALAIVVATPVNFVGNKMWSFSRPAPSA